MVEFAIENAQALKKRALRQTKVQEQTAGKRAPREAPDNQEAGATSHKQQRKRKRDDAEVLPLTTPVPKHACCSTHCYSACYSHGLHCYTYTSAIPAWRGKHGHPRTWLTCRRHRRRPKGL